MFLRQPQRFCASPPKIPWSQKRNTPSPNRLIAEYRFDNILNVHFDGRVQNSRVYLVPRRKECQANSTPPQYSFRRREHSGLDPYPLCEEQRFLCVFLQRDN